MRPNEIIIVFIVLIFSSTKLSASLLNLTGANCRNNGAASRNVLPEKCNNDKNHLDGKMVSDRKDVRFNHVTTINDFVIDKQMERETYTWQEHDDKVEKISREIRQEKETLAQENFASTGETPPLNNLKLTLEVQANSELLTHQAKNRLFDFVDKVPAEAGNQILIEGYTASDNNTRKNIELSQQRADRVKELLIEQGIAAEQIIAVGRGIENPLGDNNTRDGRRMNRRVEISIITQQ